MREIGGKKINKLAVNIQRKKFTGKTNRIIIITLTPLP